MVAAYGVLKSQGPVPPVVHASETLTASIVHELAWPRRGKQPGHLIFDASAAFAGRHFGRVKVKELGGREKQALLIFMWHVQLKGGKKKGPMSQPTRCC